MIAEPQEKRETAEVAQEYINISSNNYLKDLIGNKGIMDVNFKENGWVMYEGFFLNGKKHGIGEMELNDGRLYKGEFKNGLANGMGLLKYFEEAVAGKWKDNMCIQVM